MEDPFKRSVNDNWKIFKVKYVNSTKKNISQEKVSTRKNFSWMTSEIKRLCCKKMESMGYWKKKQKQPCLEKIS